MKVLEIRRVMKLVGGSAQTGGLIEGSERSALDAGIELGRPRSALGDDIDDAADGVRPV